MADPGVLVMTGATGTVGTALLKALRDSFPAVVTIGRRPPVPQRPADHFIHADLSGPDGLDAACAQVTSFAGRAPVGGLVLAAGVDSRAGLNSLTRPEWDRCLAVNAFAPLRLLAAATARRTGTAPLPVVVWSSDVAGGSQPETVVYAASKAALEESMRHAMADMGWPGAAVLLIRLPDIGVPMMRADGARPAGGGRVPDPVLGRAVDTAAAFLTTTRPQPGVELWHA